MRFLTLLTLFSALISQLPAYGAATTDNSAKNLCLRILSYNINGLSGPVPDNLVIDAIKELDADLIGLQEVYSVRRLAGIFNNDARGILEKALREAGYRTYWSSYAGANATIKPFIDPLVIYEPGNLLAVREDTFEVVEAPAALQLSYYPRALGLGRENRVIQHIGLRWRQTGMHIDFYNSHLTHRGRRNDREDTPLMNEVRKVLRILTQRTRNNASILFTADINLTPDNHGYRLLIEDDETGPGLIDTYAAANPEIGKRPATLDPENTFFSRHSLLGKLTGDTLGPPPLHLDYVFLGPKDTTPLSVQSSQVVLDQRHQDYNYSDHYGVLSESCRQ